MDAFLAWVPVIILVAMLVVGVASVSGEGLWSNALRALNVVFAGLIAMNFFEPLAELLEGQMGGFKYFYDFLMVWALFWVSYGLLHFACRKLSHVRVRFLPQLDQAGGYLFTALAVVAFFNFASATLHMAPMKADYEVKAAIPLVGDPDLKWLSFMHKLTGESGAYYRGGASYQFDPDSNFILRYQARREEIAENGSLRVKG